MSVPPISSAVSSAATHGKFHVLYTCVFLSYICIMDACRTYTYHIYISCIYVMMMWRIYNIYMLHLYIIYTCLHCRPPVCVLQQQRPVIAVYVSTYLTCIFIYIYKYICVSTYIYICIYIHIYICIYKYMCVLLCVCEYISYIYIHIHI